MLTYMFYINATDRIVERGKNNHYEHKMCPKEVEHSTSTGLYLITHGVKVLFFITELSRINIISYHFYINNYEGSSVIGYDIIIGWYLMVKSGITDGLRVSYFPVYTQ